MNGKKSGKANNKIFILTLLILVSVVLMTCGKMGVKQNDVKRNTRNDTDCEKLEGRLEDILSDVKGAGKVKVMIVFKDDGKENIAMNSDYENSDGKIQSKSTAVMTSGREAVVLSKSIPEVQGVIVTAEGAENEDVKENLKKAVVALLPVLEHRVEILPME